MKKTTIIIISVAIFLLVGGGILFWSDREAKLSGKGNSLVQDSTKIENSDVRHFTDDNFEAEVVQASKEKPILIDFYADWCFPCRMLDPILQELAKDMRGKAIIGRVDTDKNLIARRFGITKIPAVFIIKDGEVKGSFFGVVPKETMAQALLKYAS